MHSVAGSTARPLLRPGTHVLRRGTSEVQVGLDPRAAFVLPATPEVQSTLDRLRAGTAAGGDPVLEVLAGRGALMDERAARAPGPSYVQAALARRLGDDALRVRDRRAATRVRAGLFGHVSGEILHIELLKLLQCVGLTPASPLTPADYRADDRADDSGPADPGVLLGVGEPDRALLDGWVRESRPHLLVRMSEGWATVGPFVQPGRTACLRCIDAHRTDTDPAWPLLVAQYSSAAAQDRPDGIGEPLDPLLSTIALGWAARDLATYAEGGRPSTWSATVTLDPELRAVETRSWLRHPECGCHRA